MKLKIVNATKLRNDLAGVLDAIDKDHPCASLPGTARRQAAGGEIFTLEDAFGNV